MSSHKLLRKQVTTEIKKRRLILFTLMFLSFLYLALNFTFGDSGFLRYLQLKDKKIQLSRDIKEIEAKNSHLQSDIKLLKENSFYLEKYAREDFGMAKPDEYIFKYDR